MRYTGEVRFRFEGDEAAARRLVPLARTFLGEMLNIAELGGLTQYEGRKTLSTGEQLAVKIRPWFHEVIIFVAPEEAEETEETEKQRLVVWSYVAFGGTWIYNAEPLTYPDLGIDETADPVIWTQSATAAGGTMTAIHKDAYFQVVADEQGNITPHWVRNNETFESNPQGGILQVACSTTHLVLSRSNTTAQLRAQLRVYDVHTLEPITDWWDAAYLCGEPEFISPEDDVEARLGLAAGENELALMTQCMSGVRWLQWYDYDGDLLDTLSFPNPGPDQPQTITTDGWDFAVAVWQWESDTTEVRIYNEAHELTATVPIPKAAETDGIGIWSLAMTSRFLFVGLVNSSWILAYDRESYDLVDEWEMPRIDLGGNEPRDQGPGHLEVDSALR